MKSLIVGLFISCVVLSVTVTGVPQTRNQVLTGLSSWLSYFGTTKSKFACQNGIFGPTLPVIFRTARCMLKQLESQENLSVNCLFFCAANVFDLLDPNTGLPSKEKYHEMVHNNFPEGLVRKALNHFDSCLDKYGAFDLEEKNCTQAGLLHACTWAIVDELVC